MSDRDSDVAVIGGGLIGLACAWRLAQRGLRVTLADPAPASAASYVAAGMLAPVTEVVYGEQRLLALNLESARLYPAFAAELEEATGRDVGYRETGTLAVAFDSDDRAELGALHAFQTRLGLEVAELTGRECRQLEPMLAPSVRGGLLVAGDHSVDNRRLAAALLAACAAAGVELRATAVAELLTRDGVATGVRLADGSTVSAPTVLLAAGAWSAELAGLPPEAVPPVRPVKGQILRLRTPAPFIERSVRALVAGHHVYAVPRADGELVVGATAEEQGFDTTPRAGGVYTLLRDAHAVLPGISELELVESSAGLRPGSPDNAPILGPTGVPGLVVATGHHRNGVLLTPVTADAIAAYVVDGALPDVAAPFTSARFSAVPA